MTTQVKKCHICGCTKDQACITDEGPCYWALEDRAGPVCSACIVSLPPDPKREKWPEFNIIVRKLCVSCAHLVKDIHRDIKYIYTCEQGKFGENQWYAWSGIKRPNKAVAETRRNCREWEIHRRWLTGEEISATKEN